jgi:hypothetical protein
MASTFKVRNWWAPYRCILSSEEPRIQAELWGKKRGHSPKGLQPAWTALQTALTDSGYGIPKKVSFRRDCPEGIKPHKCRANGTNCSLHNYGLAVDIDPFGAGNDYFVKQPFDTTWDFGDTKIKRVHVTAVENLQTVSGAQLFRWKGWDIGDSMHFQIDCPPSDIASGIAGQTTPVEVENRLAVEGEVDMAFTPEEEKFLKQLFKVVVKDMESNATFARFAIQNLRDDIITRAELVEALRDLPSGDVDELATRLNQ